MQEQDQTAPAAGEILTITSPTPAATTTTTPAQVTTLATLPTAPAYTAPAPQRPSIGRVVHYWPDDHAEEPSVALIVAVFSDTCVSAVVFDAANGHPRIEASIPLETVDTPPGQRCWAWPPRA